MLIIDPGNSYYKVSDGLTETIYPAVIGEVEDAWSEKSLPVIDGYHVGIDALNHTRYRLYSLQESKSEQSTLPILVKYAQLLYPDETELLFVLPYSNFKQEKAKILEMYPGSRALPQTYCAAMDFILEKDGSPKEKIIYKKNVLAIGIGFLNTHYIFLHNGNTVRDLSFPSENGVHRIYRAYGSRTGREIYQIDSWDGWEAVVPLYPSLARIIQTDIESHYRLKDIDMFLLLEGGSGPIFDYFPYDKKILHPDQFSNVRGAIKVANGLWKKQLVSAQTAN